MADYKMELLSESELEGLSVLKWGGEKGQLPSMTGGGQDNCLCAVCGNAVCKDVSRGNIMNLVFQCPNCGTYNWLGKA